MPYDKKILRGAMTDLKSKKISDSAINDQTYKVFPNDLNSNDTVFGGLVMGILDRVALVVAERHSEKICVTAAVDSMHFLAPARKGDILVFRAAINRTWRSSMEVGVKVLTQHYKTGETGHILSAYFTFVAVDEHGQSVAVPPILPETSDEKRRYAEAEIRRERRKVEKEERMRRRQELSF
jgi:acyl-CoA hydrolase